MAKDPGTGARYQPRVTPRPSPAPSGDHAAQHPTYTPPRPTPSRRVVRPRSPSPPPMGEHAQGPTNQHQVDAQIESDAQAYARQQARARLADQAAQAYARTRAQSRLAAQAHVQRQQLGAPAVEAPSAMPGFTGPSARDLIAKVAPIYTPKPLSDTNYPASTYAGDLGSQALYKRMIDRQIATLEQQYAPGQAPPRAQLEQQARQQLSQHVGNENPGGTFATPQAAQQAQQEAVANQGAIGYAVRQGLQSLVPTRTTSAILAWRRPSVAGVASDVANAAAFMGPDELFAPLRAGAVAARAFREEGITANAVRVATQGMRDAKQARLVAKSVERETKINRRVGAAVNSPERQQYIDAIRQAPNITSKEAKHLVRLHDAAANAIAKARDITPANAWELMYRHASFENVRPTIGDLSGQTLAQAAAAPELHNLADVPEHYNGETYDFSGAAKSLLRSNRGAAPADHATPKKLTGLLEELRQRALSAAEYRHWYSNSAQAVVSHVHGDTQEADKLAALIAVYSPRAAVYSKTTEWNNLDRAINAYDEYKATGKVSPTWSMSKDKGPEGDWQTIRAQNIMEGKFDWHGLKTNRFYRNFLFHIDPEKYAALFGKERFGTIDTWMRRAFRYPAKQATREEETLFGTEHVPHGKKEEPITDKQYAFMEAANRVVARSLGWSPEEAQSAIWTSIKAEAEGTPLSQAGFDFSDALAHRESRQATPLAPEQLQLSTTTTDHPTKAAVDAAVESSREPDGGFTLSALLNPDNGNSGYAVAYGAYESRSPAPLTREALLAYRNKHLALLRSNPDLRIGGWHNPEDGQVYLDVSRVFDSKDAAMKFAEEQGQVAVFNRATFESEPTTLTAERADEIKSGLKEQGHLDERGAHYDDLLLRAYNASTGENKKELTSREADLVEGRLFDWADKNPGPEADHLRSLYHDMMSARTAPDPETLFQADSFMGDIARAQGRKPADPAVVAKRYAGKNLLGLPEGRQSNQEAQQIAEKYMRDNRMSYGPPKEYATVDADRAKRIAEWYDSAVSNPNSPSVVSSYNAMIRETLAQYRAIERKGYTFEFYPEGFDPYPKGPSQAIDDLRSNRHLYVFPTDSGFGSLSEADQAHPLLKVSPVRWGDRPVTHNDLFRAVHDFMGHYKEGVGFRADGEENAWRAHSAMYSEDARPAMTAETRGQNSWVNYGPHGEHNRTATSDTIFADQKAVIAPDWIVNEGSGRTSATLGRGRTQFQGDEALNQEGATVKGALTKDEHGNVLQLFRSADVSTAVHELGHVVEDHLPVEDRVLLAHHGLGPDNPEGFARSFEAYFAHGEAPNKELRKTFRTIAEGMAKVYEDTTKIPGARINPDIRQTFDRFFLRESLADPEFAARVGAAWFAQDENHREVDLDFGKFGRFKSEPDLTPAEQVREGLKGAASQRGKQDVMYSEARKEKAELANLALMKSKGFDAYIKMNEVLRGELPKIDFRGFSELNSESLQAMMQEIFDHPTLQIYSKKRAADALVSAINGKVPTRSEQLLLEHVFGKKSVAGLSEIPSLPKHILNALIETLNIPRTMMASLDLSAPFRQGLVISTRHRSIFFKNFNDMVRALGSETYYKGIMDDVKANPDYERALFGKLSITDMEEEAANQEEQFMGSNYAEKITGVPLKFVTGGKIQYGPVRASGRAYTGFLVKTRMDVFSHLLRVAKDEGKNINDEKFIKDLARYINSATGRGPLGDGVINAAAPLWNTIFFSPRLMASRFDLLLAPLTYARTDPFVRRQALGSMLRLYGAAATILGLAAFAGAKVNLDPRNADFAKIRVGNSRVDILGGFQQPVRVAAQVGTGKIISSTTGQPLSLGPQGPGAISHRDIIERFFEGKLAPVPSMLNDWAKGTNFQGNKFTWGQEVKSHLIPLLGQDAADLYRAHQGGMNGIAAATAGYGIGSFGFGIQTYGPKKVVPKTSELQADAKKIGEPSPTKAIIKTLDVRAQMRHASSTGKTPTDRLKNYLALYKTLTGKEHPYLDKPRTVGDAEYEVAQVEYDILYDTPGLDPVGLSNLQARIRDWKLRQKP